MESVNIKYFLVEVLIIIYALFVHIGVVNAQALINEVSPSSSPDWVEVYFFEGEDPGNYQLKDGSDSGNTKSLSEAVCAENICVVDWSNRLDNEGDTVILLNISSPEPVDQITYGGEGNICIPGSGLSIGRIASLEEPFYPTNVWERFYTPSKGISNKNSTLNPCPSPTPVPTSTQAPTPKPTFIPTPTPIPTHTPIPTRNPTNVPTVSLKPENHEVEEDDQILGISGEDEAESETDEKQKSNSEENKSKFPLAAGVFILIGLGLIGIPVANYFRLKRGYNQKDVQK